MNPRTSSTGSSNSGSTGRLLWQDTQRGLQAQMEAWCELLARCGQKPGRKSVHALRVATLRLRAELEYCAPAMVEEPHARAVQRWLKHSKKLRRALGPVRQLDVYLDMLARLRRETKAAENGDLKRAQESLGAIYELQRSFKRRRQEAAKELETAIERRKRQLRRLAGKVESALAARPAVAGGCSSGGVAEQIAKLREEFSELNEQNLHAFRKRIKKVRYLAETVAHADPGAAHQTAALRRMTAAVGEWHDWQTLAAEARHAWTPSGEAHTMIQLLQAKAARSLAQGLALCQRSMARQLGDAANQESSRADLPSSPAERIPRKPAVSVPFNPHIAAAERLIRAS